MPRQKTSDLRRRYAGLIDFLNTGYLDKKNWKMTVHRAVSAYCERPGGAPIALSGGRDLEISEAIRMRDTLRTIFKHDRPRAFATLDLMQAVWFVAAELMREHYGLRYCDVCGKYFLPREGQKTCGATCARKKQNADRRRARATDKQSRRLERTAG